MPTTISQFMAALKTLGGSRVTIDVREEDGVDQYTVSLFAQSVGVFGATSSDVDAAVAGAVDAAVVAVDAKLIQNQTENQALQAIKSSAAQGPLVPRPLPQGGGGAGGSQAAKK